MTDLRLKGELWDAIELQARDGQEPSLVELAHRARGRTPTREKHGCVASPKELLGPIDPELISLLAMEVSSVGMRNERESPRKSNEKPNALSGADILGNPPCR